MNIAIVKLSALGDIIHAMIVLQFIKQHYPHATIDWIVDDNFKEILEHNPDIRHIIPLKIKSAKQQKSLKMLINELKKVRKLDKYDFVIDMQGLLKSAIITRLISASIRVGFDKNSIREKLASYVYGNKVAIAYAENVIYRNVFLISKALNFNFTKFDIDNKQRFLHSKHKEFNLASNKKNIVLVLGASFASKIYPVEKYAKIVENIDANFISTWGGEKELDLAKQLKNLQPKIHISEKLNLNDLKSLISQIDLVIGGDTGPVHMAWATHIKSITLFGTTPYGRNTWQTNDNIVLSSKKTNVIKVDKYDNSIATIDDMQIVDKIQTLL
jgi:heptosyltransferase-1